MTTYYLHTLDGCPATFMDGHLVFAHLRIKPATSLRQIRREQAASREWDAAFDKRAGKQPPMRYGYVTISVHPKNSAQEKP